MKNITYVVIDESGATHQKENDYFIIGGYITKQIYKVKSVHKKIERELKEEFPRLKKLDELKGCYLKSQQKARFLNELFKIPSTVPISIIVDKKHLWKRKHHNENIKYNYFLQLLLNFILNNHKHLMDTEEIELLLDNRNVSVGSLNSLEDYLNSSLGLTYNKVFKVKYRNSKEHREVQFADLISNVLFGHYNYRSKLSTYYLIPAMKHTIISKFPYKEFKEPELISNKNNWQPRTSMVY